MNKLILFASLFLFSCSPIEKVEVTPTKIVTTRISNDKPRLTEFVFDDFTLLGNPPDAEFHSIDFYWTNDNGITYFPLFQLRMGWNDLYQSDSNGYLWIVQHDNGYAYFHSYLNRYEVVKVTLVYYNGFEHSVLPNVENRKRIPHYWGYNPIVEVRIGCLEYE